VGLKETQNITQVNMCLNTKGGLSPKVSFISAFSVAYWYSVFKNNNIGLLIY